MALAQARPFSLTLGRVLGRVVVTVHGQLDCVSAPVLEQALTDLIERQGNLDVIIDLAPLDFVDSGGLAALIAGRRMAKAIGGDLILSNPRPQTRKVLEATGTIGLFTVTRA